MKEKIGVYDGYPAGSHTAKDGTEFPLFVSDRGQWLTRIGDVTVVRGSRDDITREIDLKTHRKAVRVSIPVTRVTRKTSGVVSFVHGVLTGLHGSNENPLVTWRVKGSEIKEQITDGKLYRYDGRYFTRLSEAQAEDLVRLTKAKNAADAAYRSFLDDHGMNVRKVIDDAIDAASKDQ